MTITTHLYPSGRVAAFADWPGRTVCGGPESDEAAARAALEELLRGIGEGDAESGQSARDLELL